ncbi:hypothetical protein MNBD_PLANCTO03-1316, partial [hydrothermal vent metagenome]
MSFLHLIKGTAATGRTVRSTLKFAHAGWIVLAAALALSLIGIYAVDVATHINPASTLDLSA